MSHNLRAQLQLLEDELFRLKSYRFSDDPALVQVAAAREVKLLKEIKPLREAAAKQADLFNAVDEDELPPAVEFSGQPKGEGQ